MSTYKLYYFDSRAAGEPIRIIFAQAGVKYEDIRYSHIWGSLRKFDDISAAGTDLSTD